MSADDKGAGTRGAVGSLFGGMVDWITGERESDHQVGASHLKPESLLLPILLLSAAIFVEVLTRSIALYEQRERLQRMLETQQSKYDTALRLQRQLEGVAAGTARLARGGNANAVQVIERLRAVGVTVNPDALKSETPEQESR